VLGAPQPPVTIIDQFGMLTMGYAKGRPESCVYTPPDAFTSSAPSR
jgi:hypothetical protein